MVLQLTTQGKLQESCETSCIWKLASEQTGWVFLGRLLHNQQLLIAAVDKALSAIFSTLNEGRAISRKVAKGWLLVCS